MPTQFKLPELGENVESGDVISVLVAEGDTIEKDQPVVELETEKATIEVPSAVGGTVQKIHVKEGDKVKVGQTILTVDESGAGKAPAKKKAAEPKAAEERKVEEKEKPAPKKEEIREPEKPIEVAEKKVEAPEKLAPHPPAPTPEPAGRGPVAPAAPSVRRLAREVGVDINQVPGMGPAGRISADDVKAYARRLLSGAAPAAAPGVAAAPAAPLPDFSKWGEIEREPMSGVRRKTAEHMSRSWTTVPHVTQFDVADITELEKFRKQYGEKAREAGGKLTVTAVALKVIASALRVFPTFAASIDMAREEIVYKKYCHIGVAVDTERGLLVPVIRDVDKKNIIEISVELSRISQKARERKLTLEDMSGGVFTITNLGGIGGTGFSPIVNYPEVAILGLARTRVEPVFLNGLFQPRHMLPLSLSYDHRVIDGADAARFLRWVAKALEQLSLIPLQG
jgi:pyruvate dehydrogenase E2 component (dihydrolipoamide acetyltransferase)